MQRAARLICVVMVSLIVLGIVMLYSTSSARSSDPLFYLQRQLAWLVLAMIAGVIVARLDYHFWQRFSTPLLLLTVLLLILVFVPGIGARIKGSYRWIRIGPFGFQPSEVAKLGAIAGMAHYMARCGRSAHEFKKGLLFPLMGLALIAGLVFLAPDYGTALTVASVSLAIMFAGGTRLVYLVGVAIGGLCLLTVAILHNPVRLGRILSFLWPEKYPVQAYHLTQSLHSFYLAGPFGVGLGNSMQKRFYLPEAHTDFIFSIIAEELGFVASLLVLLLFLTFFFCGMTISARAPDRFGRLLGFGVTTMLSFQAAINMAVVTGLGPTKGLPLPFISYGGSSLVMSVVMTCILLSIARVSIEAAENGSRTIRDRAHHM